MKTRIYLLILICFAILTACSQQSTWQEQYDLGVRYLSEGNYEEAIIAFTAAIEIEPKLADAYIGRGQAYVFLDDTEENLLAAEADYEEVIMLDDKNPEGYLGLADVYIRMGEYDKALEVLKDGVSKTNNDADIAAKLSEMESGNINDSSGNLRRINYYNESGDLLWYHILQYDQNGKKTAITVYDANGQQKDSLKLEYDEHGQLITTYGFSSHRGKLTVDKRSMEYDADGNSIKTIYYNSNGEVSSCQILNYENNKLVRDDVYDADGTFIGYDIYTYNSKGLMEAWYGYDADGGLLLYSKYTYDEDGNLIEEVDGQAEEDGTEKINEKEIYHYDANGKIIGDYVIVY